MICRTKGDQLMGLLDILFKINNKEKFSYRNVDGRESFDEVAYNKFNEQKSLEFCSRNDLSTVEGIMSIPVSEDIIHYN